MIMELTASELLAGEATMTIDRLDAMRTFVAIVEAGSFSAAAKRLGVSVPAISRRLSGFEERIGMPLLHRTTRSVECTEYGQMYFDRATRILTEIESVELELAGLRHAPAGLLRVSAPSVFGRTFVAPVIPEFLNRYPRIRIDLSLVRDAQSSADAADAAIGLRAPAGRNDDKGCRTLGTFRHVLCAAPDYLRRAGTPSNPQDLSQHDCIVESASEASSTWQFQHDGEEIAQHIQGRLACDDAEAVLNAALAGSGVARIPSFQVRDHVRANKLEVLLEAYEPPPASMQIAYTKLGPTLPKVSAFVQFLSSHIPQERMGL
jgi:DNA-binding transcriptional LysR family regulator